MNLEFYQEVLPEGTYQEPLSELNIPISYWQLIYYHNQLLILKDSLLFSNSDLQNENKKLKLTIYSLQEHLQILRKWEKGKDKIIEDQKLEISNLKTSLKIICKSNKVPYIDQNKYLLYSGFSRWYSNYLNLKNTSITPQVMLIKSILNKKLNEKLKLETKNLLLRECLYKNSISIYFINWSIFRLKKKTICIKKKNQIIELSKSNKDNMRDSKTLIKYSGSKDKDQFVQFKSLTKMNPKNLNNILRYDGWYLERLSKHYIYNRQVEENSGLITTQVFSRSCTPSDYKSYLNMIAELRRRNQNIRSIINTK